MTRMHNIAVAARKGGVGKTTIACGLASVFAHKKIKVLIIDLDPQSNAAFVLGSDPTHNGTAALLNGESPSPLVVSEYLSVLPGGPDLINHAIQQLHPEELSDVVEKLDYDILIFDCPPGNEYLERFALIASTTVIVVTDAHPLAVIGAGRVLEELQTNQERNRKGAKRWAIVESRIDLRRSMDKDFDMQLERTYPQIKRLVVHQDTQLSLAAADRTPIMSYSPNCRGVKDLNVITSWITNNG